MDIITYLTYGISAIGVAVIAWGVVLSAVAFVRSEVRRLECGAPPDPGSRARRQLSSYLLLGLECLVSADIITTVIKPTLQDVAVLGSIVAIRTVLNYFLNLEIKNDTPPGNT